MEELDLRAYTKREKESAYKALNSLIKKEGDIQDIYNILWPAWANLERFHHFNGREFLGEYYEFTGIKDPVNDNFTGDKDKTKIWIDVLFLFLNGGNRKILSSHPSTCESGEFLRIKDFPEGYTRIFPDILKSNEYICGLTQCTMHYDRWGERTADSFTRFFWPANADWIDENNQYWEAECIREEVDTNGQVSMTPSHQDCGGCKHYRNCPDPVVVTMRNEI